LCLHRKWNYKRLRDDSDDDYDDVDDVVDDDDDDVDIRISMFIIFNSSSFTWLTSWNKSNIICWINWFGER
jgi:hypothetical protein